MLYPEPEAALQGLSGEALESAYRTWAKRLHPDGPDGDHEAFLRLRKAYEAARAKVETKVGDFDPWEAVRETGWDGPNTPEDCLFASLERWRQAGSPTTRPVPSPSTGARNRRILRTVLHWAAVVDPSLARDFALLVRFGTGPLRTTAASRAERESRLRLAAGLDGLIRWRREGRKATADLARERLEAAIEAVELHGLPRSEITRIAEWMLQRLNGDMPAR
ncbi:MAG TPA: J domain-containing protein [Magnetospirillaceae bacterium]|nr:J domain-containing protein [Magnetospirillaceae bacterium]